MTAKRRAAAGSGKGAGAGETVDAVAFSPHPDDAELFCGGTLALLARLGYRTAIVDLTAGELGTRGSVETRRREAEEAAQVLGLARRLGLGIPDGGIEACAEHRLRVIRALRELRPRLVLLPYREDRHPDHEHASRLVREAAFYAGLRRIETGADPFRPAGLFYYMGHVPFPPSVVVDVGPVQRVKEQAIACYASQFAVEVLRRGGLEEAVAVERPGIGDPGGEPPTYVSSPFFLEQLLARSRYHGSLAGVEYGEPFYLDRPPLIRDPLFLFPGAGEGPAP